MHPEHDRPPPPPCVHFCCDDDGAGSCLVGRRWPNGCHMNPFGGVGCAQYQDSHVSLIHDEHRQTWLAEWRRQAGAE